MWLLAGVGAIFAGLVLLLREALPLMTARRTGVILTRGSRPQKVDRQAEPDRFDQLFRRRAQTLGGPVVLVLGGLGWLALNVLGLLATA